MYTTSLCSAWSFCQLKIHKRFGILGNSLHFVAFLFENSPKLYFLCSLKGLTFHRQLHSPAPSVCSKVVPVPDFMKAWRFVEIN